MFGAHARELADTWSEKERHVLGTQTFVPLNGARHVVPVAGGEGRPDPATLAAHPVACIRGRIDERLRDPALTIESIATEPGMSVGHQHRLFKSEPLSPSQYLWKRRLEACSRELLDPRRRRASVAAIAFARGFNDAAHFSRALRGRFYAPPREWRRQGAVSA